MTFALCPKDINTNHAHCRGGAAQRYLAQQLSAFVTRACVPCLAQEGFQEKHGVKLGFMSAFVKASSDALRLVPAVNAVIEGDELVYRDYTDISIAVATPKGLVVPVLRNVDALNFAGIEKVQPGL